MEETTYQLVQDFFHRIGQFPAMMQSMGAINQSMESVDVENSFSVGHSGFMDVSSPPIKYHRSMARKITFW